MKLIFLTDITTILNELNLRLQSTGQTVMDLYETCMAFASMLEVYSRDIQMTTFRYFKHLKEFTSHHNTNVADIGVYIGGS